MKRKVLSLFLVVVMAVSLFSACGGKDNGGSNDSVNENKEVSDLKNELKTLEFSTYIQGKTGFLTYNESKINLVKSDEFGAEFDMEIPEKNETVGVTFQVHSFANATEYYQDTKNSTEGKVVTSEFSDIKTATINNIPVSYFTRVYSMNGETENKDISFIIDFPTIDYSEYVIVLIIYNTVDAEPILAGLKELLKDVEILGIKPEGVENGTSEIKNDEFDANIYRGQEIFVLSNGKTVNVYYNPDIVTSCQNDSDTWLYINDNNDNPYAFSFSEAATAEDYINGFIQSNDHLEFVIAEHKETKIAGRTVHTFLLNGKDNLSEEYGAIELASGVLLTFKDAHVKRGGETGFENVIEALKFVVE